MGKNEELDKLITEACKCFIKNAEMKTSDTVEHEFSKRHEKQMKKIFKKYKKYKKIKPPIYGDFNDFEL